MEETAQWVNDLPCKHKDLISVPRPHIKKPGVVAFVIPVAGRQRQADAWSSLPSQSRLLGKFHISERSCLIEKDGGILKEQG